MVVFAVIAATHLAITAFLAEPHWALSISKAALMPALIWQVWRERDRLSHSWLLVLALLFSWAGDLFLISVSDSWFLWGVAAFWLAHLSYIALFWRSTPGEGLPILRRSPLSILPILLVCAGLIVWLWPDLGEMRIVVLAYALIIGLMGLSALARFERVHFRSFQMVLTGAMLFMLSDSLIAIGRFSSQFAHADLRFWVMLSYCLAQGMIVWGMIVTTPRKVIIPSGPAS